MRRIEFATEWRHREILGHPAARYSAVFVFYCTQFDNVRAVLASSAISLRQNSHLEFLLSHLFPVWPGGMRVALESILWKDHLISYNHKAATMAETCQKEMWPCLFCCVFKSGVRWLPRKLFSTHGTFLYNKTEKRSNTEPQGMKLRIFDTNR